MREGEKHQILRHLSLSLSLLLKKVLSHSLLSPLKAPQTQKSVNLKTFINYQLQPLFPGIRQGMHSSVTRCVSPPSHHVVRSILLARDVHRIA